MPDEREFMLDYLEKSAAVRECYSVRMEAHRADYALPDTRSRYQKAMDRAKSRLSDLFADLSRRLDE